MIDTGTLVIRFLAGMGACTRRRVTARCGWGGHGWDVNVEDREVVVERVVDVGQTQST
jgi:hypothetical protein